MVYGMNQSIEQAHNRTDPAGSIIDKDRSEVGSLIFQNLTLTPLSDNPGLGIARHAQRCLSIRIPLIGAPHNSSSLGSAVTRSFAGMLVTRLALDLLFANYYVRACHHRSLILLPGDSWGCASQPQG